MFAVLTLATALGDAAAVNPALHHRLTERMVAALRTAGGRHPDAAAELRGQAEYLRLGAEVVRGWEASTPPDEVRDFALHEAHAHLALVRLADRLADPALDAALLAAQPTLLWGLVRRYELTLTHRRAVALQGRAAWHKYRREVRPAVVRVAQAAGL